MRRSYADIDSAYIAMKAGFTDINSHSNLDAGSFVFEMMGTRWANELGYDDYNIKSINYWTQHYLLYKARPEGQNCIVINPKEDIPDLGYYGGQMRKKYAPLVKKISKPRGGAMIFDLSEVYSVDAEKYKRGFMLGDDRQTVLIQDEITLKENNSYVYWFMHTKADLDIAEDEKSVIMTLNGKKVKVEAVSNASEWHFEEREPIPFENSPDLPDQLCGEYEPVGIKKLSLCANASGQLNITVKFMPETDDSEYSSPVFVPMDSWECDDGALQVKEKKIALNTGKGIFTAGTENAVSFNSPYVFQSARLYLDGEEIGFLSANKSGRHIFYIPDSVTEGKHFLWVSVLADDGNTYNSDKSCVTFAQYTTPSQEGRTSLGFEECTVGDTSVTSIKNSTGGYYSINLNDNANCEIGEDNEKGKLLKIYTEKFLSSAKPYIRVMHGKYSGSGGVETLTNCKITAKFDLYTDNTFTEIRVGVRDKYGDTLFAFYPFRPQGYIGNSNIKYQPNTWYTFVVNIDLIGQVYSVFCDKIAIEAGEISLTDFQFFDITVAHCTGELSCTGIDNIELYRQNTVGDRIYLKNNVIFEDGKALGETVVYSTCPSPINLDAYFCAYSGAGERLETIFRRCLTVKKGENRFTYELLGVNNYKYKLITLESGMINPLGKMSEKIYNYYFIQIGDYYEK